MVSNVLDLKPDELVRRLEKLRAERFADPEYQTLRQQLPEDWPV